MLYTRSEVKARHVAVSILAVVLLGACGSTAQTGVQTVLDGGPQAGRSVPSYGLNDRGGIKTSIQDEAEWNQGLQGQGGMFEKQIKTDNRSASRQQYLPGKNAPVKTRIKGNGFTADEIYIGYGTFESVNEMTSAFGVNDGRAGVSQKALIESVVRSINSNGGIAGRQVRPVIYDFETQDIVNNTAAAAEKACTYWTQDRPVFAAVNLIGFATQGGGDEVLASCMAKSGIPLVANHLPRPDSIYGRFYPYLYAISGMSMERFVRSLIGRLTATGYFHGWDTFSGQSDDSRPVKVGIASARPLYGDEFRKIVRRELAKHRLAVGAEVEYSGDSSREADEAAQAVVRFQRAGVTHIVQLKGSLPFFRSAEQQHYRPRYTFHSVIGSADAPSVVPREQLRGARGIGWIPTMDVLSAQDPGPTSSGQARCRNVLEKSNQDLSGRSTALYLGFYTCDASYFIQNSIGRAELSASGLRRGSSKGSVIRPSLTFDVAFAGARSDGAAAIRDFGYFNDCSCFNYSSRNIAI